MKTIKQFSIPVIAFLIGFAFLAFSIPQEQKEGGSWKIPSKYQKMENPYKGDASLLKVGKMLYSKHCKSCHGKKGMGDGTKAVELETFPGDFTSDEFHEQADGVIYYQSIIGRDEMPSFDKKISDEEDQWAVIMYIQSLY